MPEKTLETAGKEHAQQLKGLHGLVIDYVWYSALIVTYFLLRSQP